MNPDKPGPKQPEEAKPKPVTNDKESKSDNKLRDALKNHGLVLATFADALWNEKDWPKDDHAMPQLVVVSNDVETSMQSSSKRLREIAEEHGVYISLPAAKRSEPA